LCKIRRKGKFERERNLLQSNCNVKKGGGGSAFRSGLALGVRRLPRIQSRSELAGENKNNRFKMNEKKGIETSYGCQKPPIRGPTDKRARS